MTEFADKIRSVSFGAPRRPQVTDRPDGTRVVEVVHDTDGGTAGVHVHHPDGRVDARVHVRPAELRGEPR